MTNEQTIKLVSLLLPIIIITGRIVRDHTQTAQSTGVVVKRKFVVVMLSLPIKCRLCWFNVLAMTINVSAMTITVTALWIKLSILNYDGTGFDYKNRCQSRSAKPTGSGGGTGNGQSSFGEVPTGSSAGSPYTNCCGEYPNREPYNNQRQICCGQGELAYSFLVTFGAC